MSRSTLAPLEMKCSAIGLPPETTTKAALPGEPCSSFLMALVVNFSVSPRGARGERHQPPRVPANTTATAKAATISPDTIEPKIRFIAFPSRLPASYRQVGVSADSRD